MCTGEVDRWDGGCYLYFQIDEISGSAKKLKNWSKKESWGHRLKTIECWGFKDTKNILSLGVQYGSSKSLQLSLTKSTLFILKVSRQTALGITGTFLL